MKATPILDRILIRIIEGDKLTKGGLHIPELAVTNSPHWRGEIVSAGSGYVAPDGRVTPLTVKDGDVVIFWRDQRGGEQVMIPFEDGELMLAREHHVMCVLTDLPRSTGLVTASGAPALIGPS